MLASASQKRSSKLRREAWRNCSSYLWKQPLPQRQPRRAGWRRGLPASWLEEAEELSKKLGPSKPAYLVENTAAEESWRRSLSVEEKESWNESYSIVWSVDNSIVFILNRERENTIISAEKCEEKFNVLSEMWRYYICRRELQYSEGAMTSLTIHVWNFCEEGWPSFLNTDESEILSTSEEIFWYYYEEEKSDSYLLFVKYWNEEKWREISEKMQKCNENEIKRLTYMEESKDSAGYILSSRRTH